MHSSKLLVRCFILFTLPHFFHTTSSFAQEFNHGTILQYHHVNSNTPAVTSISPDMFKQHLNLIRKEGFSVLPLDTIISSIKLGIPFKKKSIAITFDDNYRSIYENAFPLLKEKHWPFTIFINPKSIKNHPQGFNLSWDELKEMKKHGATVANHTQSHWHLLNQHANESKENWKRRVSQDISSAQNIIESKLGPSVKWVAYPYGEFNETLKQLIQSMGYLGFSQQSGAINHTTNWQAIPRFPASGIYSNIETLKTKLHSRPFEVFSEHPLNKIRKSGEPAPALELIVNRKDVKHRQLNCFFAGEKIYSEARISGNQLIIDAQLEGTLPFGRSRYNCTAPAQNGGFFWYSMPFVATNKGGEWQD